MRVQNESFHHGTNVLNGVSQLFGSILSSGPIRSRRSLATQTSTAGSSRTIGSFLAHYRLSAATHPLVNINLGDWDNPIS